MVLTCLYTNTLAGAALRDSNCWCGAPMHLNVPRARALSSSVVFPRSPPAPEAARPRPTRQAHAATAVTRADLAPAPSTDCWRIAGGAVRASHWGPSYVSGRFREGALIRAITPGPAPTARY